MRKDANKSLRPSRPKFVTKKEPRVSWKSASKATPPRVSSPESRPLKKSFSIVGIGASAGGLEAFTQLLTSLPMDTGMGFVLVQHLDPAHESALAQLLAKASSMPVREVTNDLPVQPNHVYVIPPNSNLTLEHGVLKLQPRKQTGGAHRSIDGFFQSLAEDQHEGAIGVILSGTASDGTLGLEAIKAEGGITFAQNEETARYDSMPRSAVAAGCVDFVLPPEAIAKELARIARHPYVAKAFGARSDSSTRGKATRRVAAAEETHFNKILALLRNHSGVDFSRYKPNTLQRRITRRMVLNKQNTFDAYAVFLQGNALELDALYADMLINVTSFFRNPEAFGALSRTVFPQIIKRGDEAVRVWVPGCSTGQEAYSIAMSFMELSQAGTGRARKLQIFATDLNEVLLDKARRGLYAKSVVQDVSPERLRRFFMEGDGGYQISKAIREMCVFARQNFISDPPFSRMDLISCRNLLIYIEPSVQKKVIPNFHYALKPAGFLFLGASESIGDFTNLFAPVDKKFKIFSKKSGSTPPLRLQFSPRRPDARKKSYGATHGGSPEVFHAELSAEREADRVTINKHAPPGVLINAQMEVIQFRGVTNPYLEPPTGKASFDLLKMARGGLLPALRAAINKAKKEGKVVRRENVLLEENGKRRTVNFDVTPLKNLKEQCYLILFEEAEYTPRPLPLSDEGNGRAATRSGRGLARLPSSGTASPSPSKKERARVRDDSAATRRSIAELERELAETRDYLQAVQEQSEAANEEVQASNEEVQSANEELQSINEELETSKEELESTNEELTTVNDEMASRNLELNHLNSDLNNLYLSVEMPILLLGHDLTIRRFTPPAEKLFNLLAGDVGRPLSGIKHNLDFPELESFVAEVIRSVTVREREVQTKDGRWYSLRARPYLTFANKFDGVVVVLVDIDVLKRTGQQIKEARDYAAAIVEAVPPLLVLDQDLRVTTANESFYRHFHTTAAQTENRLVFDLGNGQWNIPKLRTFLEDIQVRNNAFNHFEVTHTFESIGRRTVRLSGRRLDSSQRILVAIDDITEHVKSEAAVQHSELRYRRLFEAAKDGILILDPETRKITDVNPFMTEVLGYTHAELVGKELWELGLWKDQEASQVAFQELQAKGYIRYDDLPLKTKGGEQRDVEFVSNLYPEGERKVIQCNIRDITKRKRAEKALRESVERFRFLAEHVPQRIFTAKSSGDADYFNQQWIEFAGLPYEQLKGWSWTHLVHPEDMPETVRLWRHSIETGEPYQFEHRLRRADGVYRWHLTRAHSLRDADGRATMWVGSNTDIEDQKQAEEHLEALVAERTRALQAALGELEAFSYSISHDLRAPLRAMHGFAQILLERHLGQLDPEGRNCLQRIASSATRLDLLIQDVLSYTRVLGAEAPLTRIDLDNLVREIIALNLDWQPPKAEIQIAVPLPPVLANTAFLTQCISNLVDNAVKFSLPGTTPRVKVWAEPIDSHLRLWIEDHGIGIAPEDHQRIFRMFERINPPNEFEGTGIGLTIVRKAIQRMGGRVGFESGPGKGSKFWIELPEIKSA